MQFFYGNFLINAYFYTLKIFPIKFFLGGIENTSVLELGKILITNEKKKYDIL